MKQNNKVLRESYEMYFVGEFKQALGKFKPALNQRL